jgi:hypothetical protein
MDASYAILRCPTCKEVEWFKTEFKFDSDFDDDEFIGPQPRMVNVKWGTWKRCSCCRVATHAACLSRTRRHKPSCFESAMCGKCMATRDETACFKCKRGCWGCDKSHRSCENPRCLVHICPDCFTGEGRFNCGAHKDPEPAPKRKRAASTKSERAAKKARAE